MSRIPAVLRRQVHDRAGGNCEYCGLPDAMGTDLASIDPESGAVSLIYHPRRNIWEDHFMVKEYRFVGRTPEGRTTIRLLQLNREDRVTERMALARAGLWRR